MTSLYHVIDRPAFAVVGFTFTVAFACLLTVAVTALVRAAVEERRERRRSVDGQVASFAAAMRRGDYLADGVNAEGWQR